MAFGNLVFHLPNLKASSTLLVRFGELLDKTGRIDRHPPGCFRHELIRLSPRSGVPVAPEADPRNTTPPALLLPADWGPLLPFRWVEIEDWPGDLRPGQVRLRTPVLTAWNPEASAFACSEPRLDALWALCRHTLHATTFAGVYFDGDRERVAYEIDAYLSQLIHQAIDPGSSIARATFTHLLKNRTWPTEAAFYLIAMAHADWWHTGDRAWLAANFDQLPPLLLLERAAPDGLLRSTHPQQTRDDHVDWPPGERDGFRFTPVNTVINALHIQALARLAEIARALGRDAYAAELIARREHAIRAFDALLYDRAAGLYRDGVDTSHHSLHSNLFPLACDIVPPERVPALLAYLRPRGMACSTYVAHPLLEALFNHDAGDHAHALLAAPGERGWQHMLDLGATVTWEAWDPVFKPNLDGSHLRSAHPAHHLSRHVLGVGPAAPGWAAVRFRPHPGPLLNASGRVPTPRGPVEVSWQHEPGRCFRAEITLPTDTPVHLHLPACTEASGVCINGKLRSDATARDGRWHLPAPVAGPVVIEIR